MVSLICSRPAHPGDFCILPEMDSVELVRVSQPSMLSGMGQPQICNTVYEQEGLETNSSGQDRFLLSFPWPCNYQDVNLKTSEGPSASGNNLLLNRPKVVLSPKCPLSWRPFSEAFSTLSRCVKVDSP